MWRFVVSVECDFSIAKNCKTIHEVNHNPLTTCLPCCCLLSPTPGSALRVNMWEGSRCWRCTSKCTSGWTNFPHFWSELANNAVYQHITTPFRITSENKPNKLIILLDFILKVGKFNASSVETVHIEQTTIVKILKNKNRDL